MNGKDNKDTRRNDYAKEVQHEKTVFHPGLCVGNCSDWFCTICAGTPRVIVLLEYSDDVYFLWSVCGHCGTSVCVGVLEKEEQIVCSGGYIRTWSNLFSCAVHAHRFTGGRIQLVFADGVGT